MSEAKGTESEPEADRDPRAGSPRGVVVATGQGLNRDNSGRALAMLESLAGRYRSRF